MTKILAVGCVAALAVLFLYACNDKLDVQQEYDFSLLLAPSERHPQR